MTRFVVVTAAGETFAGTSLTLKDEQGYTVIGDLQASLVDEVVVQKPAPELEPMPVRPDPDPNAGTQIDLEG